MADNAGRPGRGWTIAGAFAGQAIILVGIAAALGAARGGPVPMPAPVISAVPAPAIPAGPSSASLLPVFTMPYTLNSMFVYTLSMDGQTRSGIFQRGLSANLSYKAPPGQDLAITLGVKIPAGLSITDLSVSLGDGSPARAATVYDDAAQPLTPGEHTFSVIWAGSASELQPGTTWSIHLATNAPGQYKDAPIATVSVGL
jgi:hypothetical protein